MSRKQCIYCGKRKNSKSFPKHSHSKDNLDNRCRHCIKKHTKIRSKLHKKAPKRTEKCECCGKITKLVLDHNHQNHTFRGWLCNRCNTGIGNLGDNIEGIIKALNYLIKTKTNE